jgi:subtilase family serine protease
MDADPLTGVVLVYTDPANGPVIGAMGGTSLACPMFSAMWSLANEKAGHWLGQAAPILSRLPPQAMNDVLPSSSPTNVAGTVVDSNGATFYSAAELAAPLENADQFVSAFWPIGGEFLELTFGTDSSLTTAKGWDNVTGYGTPLGLAFIEAAAKQ